MPAEDLIPEARQRQRQRYLRAGAVAALGAVVAAVLVASGLVLISGSTDSAKSYPVSSPGVSGSRGWTGKYFWETGPAFAPNAALLTLLQSPSGVHGTWTEATTSLPDTPWGTTWADVVGPHSKKSFPVHGWDVTSSSLSLTGSTNYNFQVNRASGGGLTMTYQGYLGETETLNFERVTNNEKYQAAKFEIERPKSNNPWSGMEAAETVPSVIPAQGVIVNGSFELFPLPATIGHLQVTSAQQAESILSAGGFADLASQAVSVTALEASVAYPDLNPPAGSHPSVVPAWVVVYTVPPDDVTNLITGQKASNPAQTNDVEVVDALTGQPIFGTSTS